MAQKEDIQDSIAEIREDWNQEAMGGQLKATLGLLLAKTEIGGEDEDPVKLLELPVHADEAAAVTAGLATNTVYMTAAGALRIKL